MKKEGQLRPVFSWQGKASQGFARLRKASQGKEDQTRPDQTRPEARVQPPSFFRLRLALARGGGKARRTPRLWLRRRDPSAQGRDRFFCVAGD